MCMKCLGKSPYTPEELKDMARRSVALWHEFLAKLPPVPGIRPISEPISEEVLILLGFHMQQHMVTEKMLQTAELRSKMILQHTQLILTAPEEVLDQLQKQDEILELLQGLIGSRKPAPSDPSHN